MSTELPLRVPKIQLTELSFTRSSTDAFEQWLADLPKANLGELSRQLYHCFLEFNQLDIAPEQRLQRLELLRPITYFTLQGLSKHFLNSSLDLTPHQRKAANLAQSLQNHLAVGYKHVILGLYQQETSNTLALALHRGLSELGQTYLRACHLYCPTPQHLWAELNTLFKLAIGHQLLETKIADDENTTGTELTLLDTFKRTLLFSLCNSNHLRQREQQHVFGACGLWCTDIVISPAPASGTFAIDLDQDLGPGYVAQRNKNSEQALWIINTQPLCDHLTQHLTDQSEHAHEQQALPTGIDESILGHLSKTWGPMLQRAHTRTPSSGNLQLALGFSATHYFISAEREFSQWLAEQGSHQHEHGQAVAESHDVWSQAVDAIDNDLDLHHHMDEALNFNQTTPKPATLTEAYPLYEAKLMDSSTGGYSILWEGALPPQLQAGELLGIKVDNQHWSLAVVRWITLKGNKKILAGLQLVAPDPRPGAIAVIHKAGGYSQYMRCFIIDDEQSATRSLMTPRISFQVGHKVRLIDNGGTTSTHLTECREQTSSFAHFIFHTSAPEPGDTQKEAADIKNDQDFNKLWNEL